MTGAAGRNVPGSGPEPPELVDPRPPRTLTGSGAGPLRPGGPRVVGLGGGHGLAVTLAAARAYAGELTAVVSVADDGGSSGRLRNDLGIPAPGDVRRCLVALADDPSSPWAAAFAHRFAKGDLAGHALGNLVIAGLIEALGSFGAAVQEAGRLLAVCGRVLPATVEPVVLTGTVRGRRVIGQTALEAAGAPIAAVGIIPTGAEAPAAVVSAIAEADQVVLGPGSLYTSVLAVTAVASIRAALAARAGGVVFVCNLKASDETVGYDVAEHIHALGRHGVVPDVVVADPAAIDLGRRNGGPRLVTAGLARPNGWSHDAGSLARVLAALAGASEGG